MQVVIDVNNRAKLTTCKLTKRVTCTTSLQHFQNVFCFEARLPAWRWKSFSLQFFISIAIILRSSQINLRTRIQEVQKQVFNGIRLKEYGVSVRKFIICFSSLKNWLVWNSRWLLSFRCWNCFVRSTLSSTWGRKKSSSRFAALTTQDWSRKFL